MNKSKRKSFSNKIVKYLRELSIVVVGIAITFTANNWINNRIQEKDFQLYLNAVKIELEENLKNLNKSKNFYKRSVEYVVYLSSNEKTALNSDSIQSYSDIMNNITQFTYKSNAFDMMKSSGEMRLIKDKETLQSIWNCYSDLDELKVYHDLIIQLKIESSKKDMEKEELTGKPVVVPMYDFFYNTDIHKVMKDGLDAMADEIEQVLSKLR
jgi:ABC-type multidrug transport system fused ATPase/permease subunit